MERKNERDEIRRKKKIEKSKNKMQNNSCCLSPWAVSAFIYIFLTSAKSQELGQVYHASFLYAAVAAASPSSVSSMKTKIS